MTEWQKLSPIAVLYYVVRTWYHVLGNVLSWLIPLIVFRNLILQHLAIAAMSLAGLLLLSVVWAWLCYRVVSYRLDGTGVDLRTGVFNKQLLQLPFDRVQNVRIEHPWYFRLTGHCQLVLESAGSSEQEVMLVALKPEFAEQIKAEVLAIRSDKTSSVDSVSLPSASETTLLNQRSLADLVMYGIGSNRGWLIVGALAPFYGYLEDFVEPLLYEFGIFNDGSLPIWQWLITLLIAFAMVMFVLTALSVVMAVISYYNFRFLRDGERYVAQMGLLNRKEVAMPISRIQEVSVQQDWLDILLKRRQLRYVQVGGTLEAKNILVPALTQPDCHQLLNDVYPKRQQTPAFTHASPWLLLVYASRYWLILVALMVGLVALVGGWQYTPWVALPAALLAGLYGMRWYRWGYAMDEQYVYLRSGWLGVKITIIPLAKIQQTATVQTPLMRRRGLSNIDWVTAGGFHSMPFIAQKQAVAMFDFALYEVEAKALEWM